MYELLPAWEVSFQDFALTANAAGHDLKSIANRRSAVRALSEWLAEHEGIEAPAEVTSVHMKRYFMHVYQVRKGSGPRTHYNDLKVFWQCACAETGQASPLGSIPRPPDIVTPPPILTAAQLKSVLAACDGSGFLALRDYAIVLMFMDSGMRRSELVALNIADVMPLKAHQVVIQRGKGGKPRITTFGPDTALAVNKMLRKRPAARPDEPLFTTGNGRRLTALRERHLPAQEPGRIREVSARPAQQLGRGRGRISHRQGVNRLLYALNDLRADLGSSRPPGRLDGAQLVIERRAGVRSQRGQVRQFAPSAEDFIEPAGNLR